MAKSVLEQTQESQTSEWDKRRIWTKVGVDIAKVKCRIVYYFNHMTKNLLFLLKKLLGHVMETKLRFRHIFTVAFLLFLPHARGSNPAGQSHNLT